MSRLLIQLSTNLDEDSRHRPSRRLARLGGEDNIALGEVAAYGVALPAGRSADRSPRVAASAKGGGARVRGEARHRRGFTRDRSRAAAVRHAGSVGFSAG